MVPSHPKAPKSQFRQISPGHGRVNPQLQSTPLSLVCLIAVHGVRRGFSLLGRRGSVGGLCRPRQRQRTHQFSVCCSGPRFFTSAGRAPPFLRPARLRRSSIIAHFITSVSTVGAPTSLPGPLLHAPYIRNARVACRHGPSGLCLPPAYTLQYKWHTPEPLAPSAFRTRAAADRASLSLSPSSSVSTHPYSCLTALLTPPRWRGSQRPA
jgi:hypothetical protein